MFIVERDVGKSSLTIAIRQNFLSLPYMDTAGAEGVASPANQHLEFHSITKHLFCPFVYIQNVAWQARS